MKTKISINIQGGNIQSIKTNNQDLEIKLYDYDHAEEGGYSKAMEVAEKRYNKNLKHYVY